MLQINEQEGKTPEVATEKPRARVHQATALEFYTATAVNVPGYVQGIVTHASKTSGPNYQTWSKSADCAQFLADKSAGALGAYHTVAAFDPALIGSMRGRNKENAAYLRAFHVDIEGSAEKYKTHGDAGGYQGETAIQKVVGPFQKVTGLRANFYISTSSGGVHLYWVLAHAVSRDTWIAYARALVELCKTHGLIIDVAASTNAAGIIRSPGSLHHNEKGTGTGKPVIAYALREEPYTLAEFGSLVGYDPAVHDTPKARSVPTTRTLTGINADVARGYPRYSYKQAAAKCGAMRKAAERNGRDTPYPVWFMALRTADISTEGRDYAHEISCGHADYDAAATDKKIDSLTGGPASCTAWAAAYGAGGPCDSCEFGEA